jgi:hypothetical protein
MVTLNLSNNQIGPQGVQTLVDVLQNNKVLSTYLRYLDFVLILDFNDIRYFQ